MSSKVPLSDIAEIIMGQSPQKSEVNTDGHGVPLLNGPTEFTTRHPQPIQFTESGRKFAEKGDILFCVRGSTTGRMNYADQRYAIGRGIGAIRGKNGFPTEYVRALLEQNLNHLLQAATGSTFPNVGRETLNNFKVNTVEASKAQQINELIVSLESKSYLNQQTNQTLEQIAQAIFKSWFVDFEPVKAKINALAAGGSEEDALLAAMQAISGKDKAQLTQLQTDNPEHYNQLRTTAELFPCAMQDSELGEIPEGWDINCIKDVAEVVKGKSYKSAELAPSNTALVTLKSFNRGGGYRLDGLKPYTGKYKPQQEVQVGDLIIAYTDVTQAADVIGKPAMVVGDDNYSSLVVSLDVAVVRPKLQPLKPFLYGLTRSKSFQSKMQSHTTGTTVLHLAKNAVPEFEFALPSQDLIAIYESQVKPIFNLVNENIQENRNLERIRDTLLPKLLSGEIDIDENG